MSCLRILTLVWLCLSLLVYVDLSPVGAADTNPEPLYIFDGITKTDGSGWSDPADITALTVTDHNVFDHAKVLQFKARWLNYWAGGGWNWHNWQATGDDIRAYNALTLYIRKTSGALTDFWLQLIDSAGKSSGQTRLIASGLLAEITTDFQLVTIPLALFDGDFDHTRVSTVNFGIFCGTEQQGECVLQLAQLKFVFDNEVERSSKLTGSPQDETVNWSLDSAWQQSSDTCEKVCLNGYWRFLPLVDSAIDLNARAVTLPTGDWGWFKVPGIWPNPQGNPHAVPTQEMYLPRGFGKSVTDTVAKLEQAWYSRELTVPESWQGRAIYLDFTLLQTHAKVYLDSEVVGEVFFPGGEVELTPKVKFGIAQNLTILVSARPVDAGAGRFMAPDRIVAASSSLKLKGLTGDVFLTSQPTVNRINDVRIDTSVRRQEISFNLALDAVKVKRVQLDVSITFNQDESKKFHFDPVNSADHLRFTASWTDAKLWDTDQPQNIYNAILTLRDPDQNKILYQTLPISFGFREFWISGRDFYLNNKKIHLRALQLSNVSDYADQACLQSASQACQRLRESGGNFFITANYGFSPGQVGYLDGLLAAADASGILNAMSLPHISDFASDLEDADHADRYENLCKYLIRLVQNRPAVILYAMNHNSMGYTGDQNPDRIDGLSDPETWSGASGSFLRIRKQGKLAESIAAQLDPTRPVYHHESGNFGNMHTINIYLNWSPRQERSDWLEHWSQHGVKPVFYVEWGMPHIASWLHYRGPSFIWTTPVRTFAWEAEFAAAILGDAAYQMTPQKLALRQREADLLASDKDFGGWELTQYIKPLQDVYSSVQAWYLADNWRSMRGWGISAILPWDQGDFWQRKRATGRTANPLARTNLQSPGIVADYFVAQSSYLNDPVSDNFVPTAAGEVFLRENQPILTFIGGAPVFTDKSHNYFVSEKVEKQLVIINDLRQNKTATYRWRLENTDWSIPKQVEILAGDSAFLPLTFVLPESGTVLLQTETSIDDKTYTDSLILQAILRPEVKPTATTQATRSGKINAATNNNTKLRLFDPAGYTAATLRQAGVDFTTITDSSEIKADDTLILGREALDKRPDWYLAPADQRKLRSLIIMEHSAEALNNRFGLRVTEWAAREVFVRTPEHPVLTGLSLKSLSNWRGDSSLTAANSSVSDFELTYPQARYNGWDNSRVWRRSNRNVVASVLIEKPSRGNWLPLIDCGFDLQYSPLLEFVDNGLRVLFCQMDISGRTVDDPVALTLCRQLTGYAMTELTSEQRKVYYLGDWRGETLLTELGIDLAVQIDQLADTEIAKSILVLGPGAKTPANLTTQLQKGLHLIALGLNAAELAALQLPDLHGIDQEKCQPYYAADQFAAPVYLGLSHSDTYWRTFPSLTAISVPGVNPYLRSWQIGRGTVTFMQVAPWHFDYQADASVRSSYRRNLFLLSRILANHGAVVTKSQLGEFLAKPTVQTRQDLVTGWRVRAESELTQALEQCPQVDFNDTDWEKISLPHLYPELGVRWYRLNFTASDALPAEFTLSLGPIDDESWVWLNGQLLGVVTKSNAPTDYWCRPREYKLRREQLISQNVLVVRVNNIFRDGGLAGQPALTAEGRWLDSFYLQKPVKDDDPYRYYRW